MYTGSRPFARLAVKQTPTSLSWDDEEEGVGLSAAASALAPSSFNIAGLLSPEADALDRLDLD